MVHDRTDRVAQQRARRIRWGVLGLVFAVMLGIVTAHQLIPGSRKPPGVDALCPFGGLETLFSLISGQGFIEKTAPSSVVLLVGIVVLAFVSRRSFCGQLCPLGALQGAFGALGARLLGKRRRLEVPHAIDRVARCLKYVVLVFFALWTWQAAELVMRPYDPWAAFAHLTSAELLADFGAGVIALGVSLAGSLVYERFFCKYLCPTGALLGLLSKASYFGVRRHESACIDCRACDRACPMNITVSIRDRVSAAECISCGECVNACPVAGALDVESAFGRRVSPVAVTAIAAGLIVVIIGLSVAAGFADRKARGLSDSNESQGLDEGFGEGSGEGTVLQPDQGALFDVTLIKGSTSMLEIAEAAGIPVDRFTERWGVPEDQLGEPLKDIKGEYGFTLEEVRAWVAGELE